MITKERLEELIKQEAIVYNVDIFGIKEIKLDKLDYVEQNGTLLLAKRSVYLAGYYYNERLFETKEEAEWEFEFGNITRTETLKLPSWEEFKKERFVEFFYNEYDYMLQYQNISKKIALYERNNKGDYYLSEATKENYIEACRIAKKLFLGEE